MEFFPPNVFNRDWETVVQSMGIRYVAWQGNQLRFTHSSLPLQGHGHSRDFPLRQQKILWRKFTRGHAHGDIRGLYTRRTGSRARDFRRAR